jgi:hypothetical protein
MGTCSKGCKCRSCGSGKSRTAKYYAANPEARKKKSEYDTKYHSAPERRKYRAELVQKNREMGKKGDGLDVSHQKGGKFILEKSSKNRARK